MTTLIYADDGESTDLTEWKDQTGTKSDTLDDLGETAVGLGKASNKLLMTVFQISLTLAVLIIGIIRMWSNSAKSKQDTKDQILKIVGAVCIAYFFIPLMQKVVTMISGALF